MKWRTQQWREKVHTARSAAPLVRRRHVFAARDQLCRLPEKRRRTDDEGPTDRQGSRSRMAHSRRRYRRTRQRGPPHAQRIQRRADPDPGQRVLRPVRRDRDAAQRQVPPAGHGDPDGDGAEQKHDRRQSAPGPPHRRCLRSPRPAHLRPFKPHDQVTRQEEQQIDDVVVGDVRGGREHESRGDGPGAGSRLRGPPQREGEERQHPRRDQIEVSKEVRRQIRRQAEDQRAKHRAAPMSRDVPAQRICAEHVRKDIREQQQVLRGGRRLRLQQRRGDHRGKGRVRMVGDRRPERIEQICGVEVREPRGREHMAHPPQVPDEAEIVARGLRESRRAGGSRAATSRPPRARQRALSDRDASSANVHYFRGLTTSTPRI